MSAWASTIVVSGLAVMAAIIPRPVHARDDAFGGDRGGVDSVASGLVCANCAGATSPRDESAASGAGGAGVPLRRWACLPSVISTDGVDSFRIEVEFGAPVESVLLEDLSVYLEPVTAAAQELRDDGSGGDRVAGDGVFTSGLFRYNTAMELPEFFARDPNSPAGLFQTVAGVVRGHDPSGGTIEFLLPPTVGLLRVGFPLTLILRPGADRQLSPHLINIETEEPIVQSSLRRLDADLPGLTQLIYSTAADAFDFFMVLGIDKVELSVTNAPENFFTGRHVRVQTEFTGTALLRMDESAVYGSAGKLLGINLLDVLGRGVTSATATHGLMHHWAAYIADTQLSSEGRYRPQTSAASLVGGFLWVDNGDGTFTRDCTIGRNGAYRAPAIDLYFMGLAAASEVPRISLSDPDEPLNCGEVITGPVVDIGVEAMIALYGTRRPSPSESQKEFRIGFVVASTGRLLNGTELTFYSKLAEHYVAEVLEGAPDPYIGGSWASIDRFFGKGVTWRTTVPMIHDGDEDGDVDGSDYALLAGCLGGPAASAGVACAVWDRDADGRVDLREAAGFMALFTGPDWR